MKTLVIKILFIIPILSMAQLHISAGAVDVPNRQDGYTIVSQLGYTQFFDRFGIGANYRNTSMRGDIYYTLELNSKYRFVDKDKLRMDSGIGAGYNLDDFDVHPILYTKGSVRLTENLWFDVIFDNFYRESKDIIKPGWRLETYLMFGFSMDFIN